MKRMQYTIRGIPEEIDEKLRRHAVREGLSLNEAAVAVLKRGLGEPGERQRHNDMDDLAGTWVKDPAFDRAMADMDRIDKGLWK